MKILLLGKNGQVGWELQRSLAPLGELIALGRHISRFCDDLTNLTGLAATVRAIRPDVIFNAAAYTAVDKAESEPELASTINAHAPEVLAREAAQIGAWLVHFSTDYVFNGSGSAPWVESDSTGPLSVYGSSKLEGEKLIAQGCTRHLIFRTSWVYAARGGNFAKTMLRLGRERERLTVINDQVGAPSVGDLLADTTAHVIRQVMLRDAQSESIAGIYHLVASGETTWFEYAKHVLEQAKLLQPALEIKASEILPVPNSAFPTPAKRPHNSRLNTNKLQFIFGFTMPHWQTWVNRMLTEIL